VDFYGAFFQNAFLLSVKEAGQLGNYKGCYV